MITLLNRKELMTDSSAEELARVQQALKLKGIKYKVKALRDQGSAHRPSSSSPTTTSWPSTSVGVGAFRQVDLSSEPASFLYRLYVRRQDYVHAYEAVYQTPIQ